MGAIATFARPAAPRRAARRRSANQRLAAARKLAFPLLAGLAALLSPLVLAGAVGFAPGSALAQDGNNRRPVPAARIFVSPSGLGDQSGARPGDAMPFGQALSLMEAATRPLTIRLLAGEYRLNDRRVPRLQRRRNVDWPLVIEGEGPSSTVFIGDRRPGDASRPLFTVARSQVTLSGFAVRRYASFINVPTNATVEDVTVRNVLVEDVNDGILLDRNKQTTARRWLIEDVTIRRYARAGIRLAGLGVEDVTVRRSTIDGGGAEAENDCFKGGIQLYEGVRRVLIEDVTVRGNVGCPAQYQQGDGIEADERGGAPDDITLRRVTVAANRDGNVDLKATNVRMEDVTSRSEGVSRFGFRLWYHNYVCVRCATERTGAGHDVNLKNARLVLRDPRTPAARWRTLCDDRSDREDRAASEGRVAAGGGEPVALACETPGDNAREREREPASR